MLRQRVITALVLVAVLLGALAWSALAFSAVAAVVVGVGLFEWLRLAGARDAAAAAAGSAFGAALLALQWQWPGLAADAARVACGAAMLAWLGVAAALVRAQRRGIGRRSAVLVVLALLFLVAVWCAIQVLLREGAVALVSAMAIVWAADIAAYFVGRAFGRRKLASQISPGKTWAGAWGAVAAVVALAFLFRATWPGPQLVSNRIIDDFGAAAAVVLLALVVAASIVGDLFESLLKRLAGVKDSSALLPGHGGVLDRIDALLPVLPLVVLLLRGRG